MVRGTIEASTRERAREEMRESKFLYLINLSALCYSLSLSEKDQRENERERTRERKRKKREEHSYLIITSSPPLPLPLYPSLPLSLSFVTAHSAAYVTPRKRLKERKKTPQRRHSLTSPFERTGSGIVSPPSAVVAAAADAASASASAIAKDRER
jgi:hypothetical protein